IRDESVGHAYFQPVRTIVVPETGGTIEPHLVASRADTVGKALCDTSARNIRRSGRAHEHSLTSQRLERVELHQMAAARFQRCFRTTRIWFHPQHRSSHSPGHAITTFPSARPLQVLIAVHAFHATAR